jgi:hypothetical protein
MPLKNDPRIILTVAPLSVLRPNQDIAFARDDASVPLSPGGQFGHVHDKPSLEGYIMHRAHRRHPHHHD